MAHEDSENEDSTKEHDKDHDHADGPRGNVVLVQRFFRVRHWNRDKLRNSQDGGASEELCGSGSRSEIRVDLVGNRAVGDSVRRLDVDNDVDRPGEDRDGHCRG